MVDQQNPLYHKDLYIIIARTNMHVGSGDEAYGLVDNRVQRDIVSGLPNINASGLKGALREYFSFKKGEKADSVIEIFGTDSFEKAEPGEKKIHQAGKFRFFNANLLSIPVRSNICPFFRATSPTVIKELLDTMGAFGYKSEGEVEKHLKAIMDMAPQEGKPFIFDKALKGAVIEDHDFCADYRELPDGSGEVLKRLIGENPVLMNHRDFKDICDDYHLPLIARNCLENGRSTNIWHEQVVPRESHFYFFVLRPGDCRNDLEFIAGEPVQIGGNASIGYGFTEIRKLDELMKNDSQGEGRS